MQIKVVNEITQARRKSGRGSRQRREEGDVERLFAEAEKAFGKIDIVVNNAGVYEFVPLEERHRAAIPQNV